MSRGFGNQVQRTHKCDCNNPQWSLLHFNRTKLGDNYTLTLECINCRALWNTRVITDEIFAMFSQTQKEAYLKVLETQNKSTQRSIEEMQNQIQSLKKLCDNAKSKIEKNNKLIEHYKNQSL